MILSFGASGTHFALNDWQGTDRVHTDLNGATAAVFASLPFGDGGSQIVQEPYVAWDFSRFADMDDATATNTYRAIFRQSSPAQGPLDLARSLRRLLRLLQSPELESICVRAEWPPKLYRSDGALLSDSKPAAGSTERCR